MNFDNGFKMEVRPLFMQVLSPMDGIVVRCQWSHNTGNTVIIQHDFVAMQKFTEFADLSDVAVDQGQVIQKGELIGFTEIPTWEWYPHPSVD